VNAVGEVGRMFIAWPLKRNELPDFLNRRAAATKLDLTPDAIEVLIDRTEGNLLAAAQEIDKLGLLAQGKRLDASALEKLVADSARFDVFKLVDAALAGDASRALHIVESLRAEGDAVPGLLGIVVKELQTMVRLGSAIDAGVSAQTAFRNERVWPSKESMYRSALVRGRSRYWEERLAHAVRVEKMGKGRLQGDAWREFGRLIAEMSDAKMAAATA
jgi:DNA polymerase-3 subunit delta